MRQDMSTSEETIANGSHSRAGGGNYDVTVLVELFMQDCQW